MIKAKGLEGKVRGWSTEEMKHTSSSIVVEDTEETIGWRALSQLDVDECRKKIAEKVEEEVLNKYKVEDSKRGAYRGRGISLEWRRVRRSKTYRIRNWSEDCWARIFSRLGEYHLQHIQSMKEGLTEEEEMKQQQMMKVIKEMTRKSKKKEECIQTTVGASVSCRGVRESLAPCRIRRHHAEMVRLAGRDEQEG